VVGDLTAEYYEQRASVEGTLLISEATIIAKRAGGIPNVPGIYSQEQIAAWKKIIDRVHAKGSKIFIQLWAQGRTANPQYMKSIGEELVSASDVPMTEDGPKPRPLTKDEIKEYIVDFAQAAKNAISAGADGVEIHGANGYLIDQFLRQSTNKRTDEYGGSVTNRARFGLQVVDAVIDAVGADRTAIRFSPWGTFQGIDYGISPISQFSHVFEELESRRRDGKGLAYIHLVEPRTDATADVRSKEGASNAFIDAIWKGVVVRAGSMRTVANEAADENNRTIVAIARDFVSNPDLPYRLAHGLELSPYDRDTFYANTSEGYTTYPFAKGFKAGPLVFA
jgi:NADPH2 dehydrogenase